MTSAQLDSIPTWPFLAGLAILWALVVWSNRKRRKKPRKWVDAPPPRNYWQDNRKKH